MGADRDPSAEVGDDEVDVLVSLLQLPCRPARGGLLVEGVEGAFALDLGQARHAGQGLELVGAGRVDHDRRHPVLPRKAEGHRRPQGRGVLAVTPLHEILAHGLVDGIGARRRGPAQPAAADDEIDLAHVDFVLLDERPQAGRPQGKLIAEVLEAREIGGAVREALLHEPLRVAVEGDLGGRGADVDGQGCGVSFP